MTGDDRILGTRVPDTPIHRASMWLEELKFGERRRDAGLETSGDEDAQRFVAEVGLPATAQQLTEAVNYYGTNFREVFFESLNVSVMTSLGPMPMETILKSVWLDGFQHGAATQAGKRGLSNDEADLGREV